MANFYIPYCLHVVFKHRYLILRVSSKGYKNFSFLLLLMPVTVLLWINHTVDKPFKLFNISKLIFYIVFKIYPPQVSLSINHSNSKICFRSKSKGSCGGSFTFNRLRILVFFFYCFGFLIKILQYLQTHLFMTLNCNSYGFRLAYKGICNCVRACVCMYKRRKLLSNFITFQ